MDYTLKLNIKAIVHFEKLIGKPFIQMDYNELSVVSKLIYCCLYTNNADFEFTYDAFETVILKNTKLSDKIFKQFFKIVELQKQFSNFEQPAIQGNSETIQSENNDLYIYKIIPILVTNCGLDINYILNEMGLDEIGLYIDNYNTNRQQELQLQRLWCYYSILPHIGKKLNSPKDLMLFNWEKEESKIDAKALADEYSDKLKDILKNANL